MKLSPLQNRILALMWNQDREWPLTQFCLPYLSRHHELVTRTVDGRLVIYACGTPDQHLERRGLIERVDTPFPYDFVYRLTDAGREAVKRQRKDWRHG